MDLSIFNRALLRGTMAGALVLAGTTACSRSDREQSGRDNTAAVLPDTAGTDASVPSGATGAATDTGITGAISDTTAETAPPNTPRARSTTARSNQDSVQGASDEAAGYREMDRDTAAAPGEPKDSARVTEDTSETSINATDTTGGIETADQAVPDTASTGVAAAESPTSTESPIGDTTEAETVAADTAAAGYTAMARDTSATPEQIDTVAAEGDVALRAKLDTTQSDAEVASETPVTSDTLVATAYGADTAVVVGDSAHAARTGERVEPVAASPEVNDTLTEVAEAEPVRPPEDSTEVRGNVTDNERDEAEISQEEGETVAAAEGRAEMTPDEVGAAAIGGNVTGSGAVSLMSRQGAACLVVDPESNEAARWDMSMTPATLNPCGLGSMNLSKVWTAK